jgi:hypothetical protein
MDMVERVARAIAQANGVNPDDVALGVHVWRIYEADAKAAIEAMREPTLH